MNGSASNSIGNTALASLSREQLEKILDASPLGMAITDYYNGIIVYVNSTLADWAQLSIDEMIGTAALDYYTDMEAVSWALGELKAERAINNFEMRMNRADGMYVWRQVNMIAIWVGEKRMILSWYNDISELLETRKELTHLAKHDALTGLANIAHFTEYLSEAVARAAVNMTSSSLLYLDLDGFKQVNDSYGHQFGNSILKSVVGRVKQCIGANDFAARIGGDEFALVIESAGSGVQNAIDTADKILAATRQPYSIDDKDVRLSMSIGVTHFMTENHSTDKIVSQADNAMYRAKHGGKNRICIYDPTLDD